MKLIIRALNHRGLDRLRAWLNAVATEAAPFDLLADADTTEPIIGAGEVDQNNSFDRFTLSEHILDALSGTDFSRINMHEGLWGWLSLFYFDQLCPSDLAGHRKVLAQHRYLLVPGFRTATGHLIREGVLAVRAHGKYARVLLTSARGAIKDTLALTLIASRQELIANTGIVELAWHLYFAEKRNKVRRCASSAVAGGLRRFVAVMQQLNLNYDLQGMAARQILDLLPTEFDTWKGNARFDSAREMEPTSTRTKSQPSRANVTFAEIAARHGERADG